MTRDPPQKNAAAIWGARARWPRKNAPLLLSAAILGGAAWVGLRPSFGAATQTFVALQVVLAPAWLGAAWWIWRQPGRVPWWFVVAVGAVLRLAVAQGAPALSSDAWRYVWDGRVQRAGISPWRYPPGAPALSHLRDAAVWPHINRPEARTIYPAGAQLLFRGLPDNLVAMRWVFICLEVATMLLIALWLRQLGQDPARTVLYAWSPLAVWEIGNSAHLDAALLPLLVAAMLALGRGWSLRAGGLLGGAASLKLYPLLAILAVPRRLAGRAVAAALGTVVALYALCALQFGALSTGFLPDYVRSAEDHNIGLRRAVEALLQPLVGERARVVAFAVCLAAMGLALARVLAVRQETRHRLRDVVLVYLLTVPTAFHPWYALWLLPALCAGPTLAGLWLVAALPLSYLKYTLPGQEMPWLIPVSEFAVPIAWTLRDLWWRPVKEAA